MEQLGQWQSGWLLIGDVDNHTELGIAYGDDKLIAENLYWDFEGEEDEKVRSAEFGQLLHTLTNNAKIIDTDTISGIVFDVTEEFDWYSEGRARAVYTLKSEDTGTVYEANASDFNWLVGLAQNYTEEAESDDDADTGN